MPQNNRQNKTTASPGLQTRRAVRICLYKTLQKGFAFERAFEQNTADLEARDRAFVRHLALTSLRRLGSLNGVLASLMERPLDPGAEAVELAMLIGLAQILILEVEPHAAVGLAVEDVKSLNGPASRLGGLVNAVLRRSAREADSLRDQMNNHPLADLPDAVRGRWRHQFSAEVLTALATALRTPPETDISLKKAEDDLGWAKRLEAKVLPTGSLRRSAGDITGLEGFEDGDWWVQDAAAALPAKLLGDVADRDILDLCAAPGGKTLQLAAAKARVTALDRSAPRLETLKANLQRTGLTATVVHADALAWESDTRFDAVLLDAPCSATGTYRRNPDGLWTKTQSDVDRLAHLQHRLLDRAAGLLRPQGTLVYCVCSMEAAEGESQWQAFLNRTPGMRPSAIDAAEVGGLSSLIQDGGVIRTHPAVEPAMDGFFIARAVRA